ncbi:hypothetical protein [Streptomyces geranii]|uniref:hypothetical protein n=1 Tax=Streptomyces geranii TaxID=2058923 RepID=UPI000D028FEC|nr:hypothetical protein [Streptomyces geranii]
MTTATPPPAASREALEREIERLRIRARVLAIIVGVLTGAVGGLVAYTISAHYGATGLEKAAYGGGTFVTFSAFVLYVEEKLGLI